MMKLTKKVALEVAISALSTSEVKEFRMAGSEEVFTAEEVIEKLLGMAQALEAKSNAPKKPTKVQEANEGIKAHIAEVLVGQTPKTISEIMALSETLGAMSNQKVSALVGQMVKTGTLVRTEEKRKAFFSLPSQG